MSSSSGNLHEVALNFDDEIVEIPEIESDEVRNLRTQKLISNAPTVGTTV